MAEVYSIGLDISKSGTGMAVVDSRGVLLESSTIRPPTKKKGDPPEVQTLEARMKRHALIVNTVLSFVQSYTPCRIAVEGYSFGSGMRKGKDGKMFQQQGTADRHEIQGIVCHEMHRLKEKGVVLGMVQVPPTTLKEAWAGSGNAEKEDMGAAAERRGYNGLKRYRKVLKVWDYNETNNEVDALALACYAGGLL